MKQTAHKGTTAKHAGTTKHVAGKGKHHPAKAKKAATHHHAAKKQPVHTAAKGHKVAKPRKLAQGDAQRGLLRLCLAPGGEAEPRQLPGASPWSALADVACCPVLALAASLCGSERSIEPVDVLDLYKHLADSPDAGAAISATLEAAYRWGLAGVRPVSFGPVDLDDPAAVLLGVELPGAHAVTVAADGCWVSWGQHYDPAIWPDAVIEEAWAVVWP